MAFEHSFKFADSALNSTLQARLRTEKLKFSVEGDGTIRYSSDDEERIESEFLGPIRDRRFPSWQLLFCPPDWVARYKSYMGRHNVPFEEQWIDEQPCFLLPRQYRPHTWKFPRVRDAVTSGVM